MKGEMHMFFFFPGILTNIVWIYLVAAVLPAVILFVYIYNQQGAHRQPGYLMWKLFGSGALAALLASVVEYIGTNVFNATTTLKGNEYYLVFALLVIGLIEEGMKFIFLKKNTWNDPNFETRFDGIIYAVAVGLGFAVLENINYVFSYGLSTATLRAFTAIPGHLSFGVIMGYFYGRARYFKDTGRGTLSFLSQIAALGCAIILHGLYDAMSMINTTKSNLIFFVILIVIYLIIFRLVRHEAETDRYV